jgi:hypothetical protein
MIPRRHVLTGGVLGAFADSAPLEAQQTSDQAADRLARAVADLRTEVSEHRQFSEIAAVRNVQKQHLRTTGRFPDYVEVGADVWFNVHDWHVRWQQPMSMGRDPQGRYTIVLNQTVVVLRSDQPGNFVGLPYDNR